MKSASDFQEFHEIEQQSIELESVLVHRSPWSGIKRSSSFEGTMITTGRMLLIMQRTSKHSVQIKKESSSSSSWGRMPILQASTKILKHQSCAKQ
ncbi:hypothetical protein HZH68_001202 [Vespula germanica]|uniref:Uncharacterized protein n=1 Tax=Vespula germanica TaxID=30212 RepID=A0A834U6H5_VESGE|nr:hypothetical protein HZH68_001202 [Vespula germanica]